MACSVYFLLLLMCDAGISSQATGVDEKSMLETIQQDKDKGVELILTLCLDVPVISVLASLRHLTFCLHQRSSDDNRKVDGANNSVTTHQTSTEHITTMPTEQVSTAVPLTPETSSASAGPSLAPRVQGLSRPFTWISSPLQWDWPDHDITFASSLPIISTCVTVVIVQLTGSGAYQRGHVLCNLRMHKGIRVLREVAECLLFNDFMPLDTVFPLEYGANVDHCDSSAAQENTNLHMCVYSTLGTLIEYPSASLCVYNSTLQMDEQTVACRGLYNPNNLVLQVQPNVSCEDYEQAPDMNALRFYWAVLKVQYICLILCLIAAILGMVAAFHLPLARNIRGYVLTITPLSALWLLCKAQQLLFQEIESLRLLSDQVGFQLLDKVLPVFPVTLNAYLLMAVTTEKFIAVFFPIQWKTNRHRVIKIFPVTVVFAALLAVVDAVCNVYFYTNYSFALGDHVSTMLNLGDSLDIRTLYRGVYAMLSVGVRGVLPTIVCCVLNAMNTVMLCKRFYDSTDLHEAKAARLKHNMICSNIASFFLINCLFHPITEFYLELEEDTYTKIVTAAYLRSTAEILFSVSNGTMIAYLCLLCPDLWKFFCSRQKHRSTRQLIAQAVQTRELGHHNAVPCAVPGPSHTEARTITLD